MNPEKEEDRDNVSVLNNRIRYSMTKQQNFDKSLLYKDILGKLMKEHCNSMKVDQII